MLFRSLIGFLISLGTFIEQDQTLNFYKLNYPETNKIFGFIDWHFIFFLNLNRIYNSYWFIFLLFVFAASLIACTFTTQLPLLQKFKLWQFLKSSKQFEHGRPRNRCRISFNAATTLLNPCTEAVAPKGKAQTSKNSRFLLLFSDT